MDSSRREFLGEVGRGMLVAGLGSGLAIDLGLGTVQAESAPERLNFGKLEPLVSLLQETKPEALQSLLVQKLHAGTTLKELVSAGALANARAFGGEDYIGFHTLMALYPSYLMASELPSDRQALPVLKVLYRNSSRLQERGNHDVLRPLTAASNAVEPTALRDAVRKRDTVNAEALYAKLAQPSAEAAFNDLLPTLFDGCEVHRVVLVSRAWDLSNLIGKEQAHTLLRQSVRYCSRMETERYAKYCEPLRAILPKLLDEHRLAGRKFGERDVDDAWIEKFCQTIFTATPAQAADAVAGAIKEGIALKAIAHSITLATNQLVLRDSGRSKAQAQANKPEGSVHGDSIGVHACDSANAWINIARASNPLNGMVSLMLAGYQAAEDRINRGGDFLKWQPRPAAEELKKLSSNDAATLLKETEQAVRDKNQDRVCALVHRYGEQGHNARPLFDVLLKYAISEDGALHAEKFYRTVVEEFGNARPAFRWRHVVALARVTASEFGTPAPGQEEARRLLKV